MTSSSALGCSADEALARVLRPGQDIVVGQAWGTPRRLLEALPRHRERLAGSRIFVGLLLQDVPRIPGVRMETFFPSGPLGSAAGLELHGARYRRSSLYSLALAFRSGDRPVDVVLAQASPARDGAHSLGVTVDFVHAAAEHAEAVVLEVGGAVPWTGPGSSLGRARAVVVPSEHAPMPLARPSTVREAEIARHVSEWIPDGATLQLGMAAWVDPLVSLLQERRGLRVHTGLVSDWAVSLDMAGALDPSVPVVGTGAGGTAELYAWLDGAGRAALRPADSTHAPQTLAALPSLRAVNSVFEVDLSGNVNCEIGPDGRRGGVAGLHDFAVAAAGRADALSIIALPAAAKGLSRIVPTLPASATSLPPGSVDVVVTEHGAADLRGLSPGGRAEALVRIAAPDHRRDLAQSVRA